MLGCTIAAFTTGGSQDPLLYGDERTLRPDSSGLIFQVVYTPLDGTRR